MNTFCDWPSGTIVNKCNFYSFIVFCRLDEPIAAAVNSYRQVAARALSFKKILLLYQVGCKLTN